MTAHCEIIGEEVIGRPGQNLTEAELRVLVGLGDGLKPATIAQHLATDLAQVHELVDNLAGKLGARSKWHLTSRGFTLGILIPNALCLLLCISAAIEMDHELFRPRNQRRPRLGGELTRLIRSTPSTAGQGWAPLTC